jgi:hypothetical protein
MNSIQMEQVIRAIVKITNSTFQLQTSLTKMVIDSYPKLSESEKAQLLSLLESLSTAYTLLNRQTDEILPA